MKTLILIITTALAILTIPGMARDTRIQRPQAHIRETPETPPAITKYDKMEKDQLQKELVRLQKEVIVLRQANLQAKEEEKEIHRVYRVTSPEEKPDVLLRMLESEVRHIQADEAYELLDTEFHAAQRAYRYRLLAE